MLVLYWVNVERGRTYGGQSYPLKPLADAMKTSRYPGLDLAGVKRA